MIRREGDRRRLLRRGHGGVDDVLDPDGHCRANRGPVLPDSHARGACGVGGDQQQSVDPHERRRQGGRIVEVRPPDLDAPRGVVSQRFGSACPGADPHVSPRGQQGEHLTTEATAGTGDQEMRFVE